MLEYLDAGSPTKKEDICTLQMSSFVGPEGHDPPTFRL